MAIAPKAKRRLKTIKSLNSIFNALQVITMARLQKIRQKHRLAQLYLAGINEAAGQVSLSAFAKKRRGKVAAIVISPNRGFCGAFNQNILYRTQNFIREGKGELEFIVFGRKGTEFLRARRQAVKDSYLKEDYSFSFFAEIARELASRFQQGEIAEAHLLFNRFRTIMRQDAVLQQLIPVEKQPRSGLSIIEPDRQLVAAKVFEQKLAAEIYFAYLDSQLGEVSARMFTLKGAIENSEELIDELVLNMNKARQQAITRDLMEIIGSTESLKEKSY